MADVPFSRREFVAATASAIAATWLAGACHGAAPGPALPGPALPPLRLRPDQFRDLEALTALIIPTDERPGAREAHVVDFIRRGLSSFASDESPLFEHGLVDLDRRAASVPPGGSAFSDLNQDQQVALVQQLEAEGSLFFEAVRIATITGFFADPEYGGNEGKTGWALIGFEDRFAWQPPFGYYDAPPP